MLNKSKAELLARFQRNKLSTADYIAGIQNRDIVRLSQAITLVESSSSKHALQAQELINYCLSQPKRAIRIGITGTPGVGKSTFIESFGQLILQQGLSLAILAVDPSSPLSKGSILGDKTRMATLATMDNVFIRPSPAGDALGGVARKSKETLAICEAAGFDVILVETVGVGQSETIVRSMVDFFLLLLLPNAGDELQGIKRGIMEMADLIFINKAEGENALKAKLAAKQCNNALHLFPKKPSDWTASALIGSALEQQGIDKVWEKIMDFYTLTKNNNFLPTLHQQQAEYWLQESIAEGLKALFNNNIETQKQYSLLKEKVLKNNLSPFVAAEEILATFISTISKEN